MIAVVTQMMAGTVLMLFVMLMMSARENGFGIGGG
jgi:hypothetical protein